MTVFAVSFILYTIGIVVIGLLAARNAGDNDEAYFLGGRRLGPWVAATALLWKICLDYRWRGGGLQPAPGLLCGGRGECAGVSGSA